MLSILFLITLLSFTYCIDDIYLKNNVIIKIQDRIITKNDFIKRAEYTIRPTYCNRDSHADKNIILNSLIAEKLMAIDIENNLLSKNYSNHFIDGYKEQKMREVLLKEQVYNLITIDSSLVQSHYNNSTKNYKIQFLSISNNKITEKIDSLIKQGVSFTDICYNYLGLSTIPIRTISYFDEHDPSIHEAIFSKEIKKNQIIGPILSKDKRNLFIEILSWNNEPIISLQNKKQRWDNVKQKIYENECIKGYDLYISNIMEGMDFLLVEKVFLKFAENTFKNNYSKKDRKLEYWGNNNLNHEIYKINPNEKILSFNDDIYTIANIELLIKKHPLIFRKENISKDEYPLELKYAIADLLRDEQLNLIAYNNNYDKHPDVLKEIMIFRDTILSNIHLKTYLDGKNIPLNQFNTNYINIIDNHLNEYIESLISKYSLDITINSKLFDTIELTNIDMHTYRKGVPYPFTIPAFPILTSKYKINYGVDLNLP